MTLRTRLTGAFLLLCGMTAFIVVVSLRTNRHIHRSVEEVERTALHRFQHAHQVVLHLKQLQEGLDELDLYDVAELSARLQREWADFLRDWMLHQARVPESPVLVEGLPSVPAESPPMDAAWKQTMALGEGIQWLARALAEHQGSRTARLSPDRHASLHQALESRLSQELIPWADECLQRSRQDVSDQVAQISRSVDAANVMMLTAGVTSLALAFGLASLTVETILRPVRALERAARAAQNGNLDSRAREESTHELGLLARVFNEMMDRIAANAAAERQHLHDLRAREKQLAATLQCIGDAVISTDTSGRVQRMNTVAENLVGRPEAEALGQPIDRVVSLCNEETGRPEHLGAGLSGGPQEWAEAYRLARPDGTIAVVALTSSRIQGGDGTLTGAVLVLRDVATERQARCEAHRRAADLQQFNATLELRVNERTAELRESEERLGLALDATQDGLWDWNLDTGQLHCRRSWMEALGYDPDAPINSFEAFQGLLHPEDAGQVIRSINEHVAGRSPLSEVEMRLRRKSGEYCWYMSRSRLVQRNTDGPLRLVGTFMNITARKAAEQKLEQTHTRLLQLSRQAGMAEVATGVLHNVGNVLNSVNVSANLLLEKVRTSKLPGLSRAVHMLSDHRGEAGHFLNDDPRGRRLPEYLEVVVEHLAREQAAIAAEAVQLQSKVDHIKQIVAMQQSYAKLSGATELLEPRELLDDALRIFSGALVRHGIEIVAQHEPTPRIQADRHAILQILVNLIANAKHALSSRLAGRQLTLRSRRGALGIQLEVEDNGGGIAPEHLPRIFQYGFTTKRDGHGFGLHTGAQVARDMGGRLKVQSEGPGKGACFILELPLSKPSDSPAAMPASMPTAGGSAAASVS